MASTCQYCGADVDAAPPRHEVGWLYGIECRRCPPERRRALVLTRPGPVDALECPDCGAVLAPAATHDDVLVVKEMTFVLCPECGERCDVYAVRKHRDVSGGTM